MKYNTAIPEEKKAALSYAMKLINKKQIVSITKVSPKRTLAQNNYLHLIIAYFGLETGYLPHEAKTVFKREANPDIFVYEKNGTKFLKSSADLTKEEMAKAIDRFIIFAAEQNVDIPPATDPEWLRQIENEIERSRYYL